MSITTQKLSDEEIVKGIHSYQRKLTLIKNISELLWILPFIVLAVSVLTRAFSGTTAVLFIVVLVISITLSLFISKKREPTVRKMNSFVGENVVKEIIAEKIEIEKYAPDKFLQRSYIENSNIVPGFDTISGSDYIKGTYKGVEIVYCDLKLERTDKETHEVETVFQGHFISLKMSKMMEGYVKIKERRTPRKEKGFFDDVADGIAGMVGIGAGNRRIEVESVAFNNQFEISTNNDEMAFYILTPQFMENIVRADALADGYTNIRFKGTDIDISVNNGKDSFEIDKTMYSVKRLGESRDRMRRDLDVVLAIVDEILKKERLFE